MNTETCEKLVRIWNRCQEGRYGFFPVSAPDLQLHIFENRLYSPSDVLFEPQMLPLGFAHLVTEENAEDSWLAALVLPNDAGGVMIGSTLLKRATSMAAQMGMKRIIFGSYRQRLYEPLHGTVAMPGIDERDEFLIDLLRDHGFRVAKSQLTMKRSVGKDLEQVDIDGWGLDLKRNGIDIVQLSQKPICYTFALIQGRQVGHCTCFTLDRVNQYAGTSRAGVYMLGVNASHRRKGIGRAIMMTSLRALREFGIQEVELMTAADNLVAQEFYATLGFQKHKKWLEAIHVLAESD